MTLNASMKKRVRRLEERQVQASRPGLAERLRQAHERWEALTPQQQAAERCRDIADDVALLDLPEPKGDDVAARLLWARRSCGRHHLAAMASLNEPDLVEPGPLTPNARVQDMEDRVAAYGAWSDQQNNRKAARQYLADVALAGDLLKETQ